MPKILLIDDDIDFRKALAEVLELEGYDILHSSNGQQGLKKLNEHIIDLIICDYDMPLMNGGELLRHVRSSKDTEALPFILMSALFRDSFDFEYYFMEKPFLIEDLFNLIKKII